MPLTSKGAAPVACVALSAASMSCVSTSCEKAASCAASSSSDRPTKSLSSPHPSSSSDSSSSSVCCSSACSCSGALALPVTGAWDQHRSGDPLCCRDAALGCLCSTSLAAAGRHAERTAALSGCCGAVLQPGRLVMWQLRTVPPAASSILPGLAVEVASEGQRFHFPNGFAQHEGGRYFNGYA